MFIWKPLTRKEKNWNKKYPNKPQIVPHMAFYIDESKLPEEAKLWNALGYENLRQGFCSLEKKTPNY